MGIQFTGLASGLDVQSIISDLMKVERTKVDNVEKDKTLVEWKKDAWNEMNSELYTFYKESLFKFKSTSTYLQKTITSSDSSIVTVTATTPSAVNGVHTIENITMAKGSFLTGDEITLDKNGDPITISTTTALGDLYDFAGSDIDLEISLDNGTTTSIITLSETDTISDLITKVNDTELDINFNYDTNFNRFFISSKDTGQGVQVKLGDATGEPDGLLTALGFGVGNKLGSAGNDAQFDYNGATLTSSDNEVTVNGLSLLLHGEGSDVTLSVNQDVDGIYESIKDFVLKYNELVMDINEKLDAESARTYKPLTKDEKSAMTEDEIKLWEDKIKGSLLRKDDILSAISRSMRNTLTLSSGVDTTGFDYNDLSSLGIVTGGYSEKGILHIKGDEDDPLYGVEENGLKTAIEENPEGVLELMTSLGTALYEDMSDRMKSSTLSSALTFYNDKNMSEEISDYEDDIYELEERLTMIEERYYKQFTAMEQAIQKSNSTADWLAQQLGGM